MKVLRSTFVAAAAIFAMAAAPPPSAANATTVNQQTIVQPLSAPNIPDKVVVNFASLNFDIGPASIAASELKTQNIEPVGKTGALDNFMANIGTCDAICASKSTTGPPESLDAIMAPPITSIATHYSSNNAGTAQDLTLGIAAHLQYRPLEVAARVSRPTLEKAYLYSNANSTTRAATTAYWRRTTSASRH